VDLPYCPIERFEFDPGVPNSWLLAPFKDLAGVIDLLPESATKRRSLALLYESLRAARGLAAEASRQPQVQAHG
jgi:hypothetical protein